METFFNDLNLPVATIQPSEQVPQPASLPQSEQVPQPASPPPSEPVSQPVSIPPRPCVLFAPKALKAYPLIDKKKLFAKIVRSLAMFPDGGDQLDPTIEFSDDVVAHIFVQPEKMYSVQFGTAIFTGPAIGKKAVVKSTGPSVGEKIVLETTIFDTTTRYMVVIDDTNLPMVSGAPQLDSHVGLLDLSIFPTGEIRGEIVVGQADSDDTYGLNDLIVADDDEFGDLADIVQTTAAKPATMFGLSFGQQPAAMAPQPAPMFGFGFGQQPAAMAPQPAPMFGFSQQVACQPSWQPAPQPVAHGMIVPQLGKIIAVPAKGTEAGKRVSRSAVSAGFGVVVGIGFPKGWMGTEKDPGPVNAPEVAIALEANNIIARRPGGTSSYPSVVFMKTGSEDTVDGKAAKAALIEAVTLMINANPAIGVSAKSAAIMEECDKRWIVMTTAQLNALKANPYGTIYSAIAARKLLH